jgi:hypothetical protein
MLNSSTSRDVSTTDEFHYKVSDSVNHFIFRVEFIIRLRSVYSFLFNHSAFTKMLRACFVIQKSLV